jgi:hypothetical protein
MRPHDNFREQISEFVWLASVQSQVIQLCAETGDDAGMRHGIKRLIAYTKAAAGTYRDMLEAKVREHERQERRDAVTPLRRAAP